jgi:hypothetical protein
MLGDVSRLPESLRHDKAYVVMWASDERRLQGVPLRWDVVERRKVFRGSLVAAAVGGGAGMEELSLVRVTR